MTLIRRIGSQAAIYGLGYGFSRILGFALLPVYTRHLSSAEYGVLAILVVTGQIATILSEVGLGAAMFREVIYRETDRRTVESTTALFLSGMSAFVLLVAWPLSPWLSRALWDTGDYAWLLQLTFLGAAFSFLETIFLARLRIEMRAVLYTSVAAARFIFSVAMIVWFLVVLERGLLGLVESTTLTAGLFALVYLGILWRNSSFTFSIPILKRLMRFGAPLLPANAASTVTSSCDRYFLQHYQGAAQVGVYSLGYTVGQIMAFFVNAIQLAWPAQMFEIAKKPDAEAILARLMTVYTAVMATLALLLSMAASDIVRLMATPDYFGAANIVPWIAASYVLLGSSYMVNVGLPVRDKMHLAGVVAVIAALSNLVFNFWLVPTHGSIGAAWAALASYAVLALLLGWANWRVWKIPYEYGKLITLAAAWLAAVLLSQGFGSQSSGSVLWRAMLLIAYGLLAWTLCRAPRSAPA